ncbi:MAG: PhoH family protein [Fidelibacterota bacterium]
MEKAIELKGVDLAALLGVADAHLRMISESFPTQVVVRGNQLRLRGDGEQVQLVSQVIHEMLQTLSRKGSLTPKDVRQLIQMAHVDNGESPAPVENVIHYGRKGAIVARTKGQQVYADAIKENDIVFSVGPAGTGKTYIAVAFAVAALENHEVDRIILCRPAVEAGENLGFLPGDLKEKVNPYLTPLYDALNDIIAAHRLKTLLAHNTIEIIPLAYMRGRTLNNAFLILDEAQNSTPLQMKMFLTRLGVNSKTVITGDITQIDLPRSSDSGLVQVMEILKGIDGIGFAFLNETDVVRHKLVRDIIRAYDQSPGNHDDS